MSLPTDPKDRKNMPIARGVLDYFPDAIAEVANVSRVGNDQHNPGQPMHWAKSKSADHADCVARHLIERGSIDTDGLRHSAKLAWRALALLQTELEEAAEKPGVEGIDYPPPYTGSTEAQRRVPVQISEGRIAVRLSPEEVAKAARGV